MEDLWCCLVSSKLYSEDLHIQQMKIVYDDVIVFTDSIVKGMTAWVSLKEIEIWKLV